MSSALAAVADVCYVPQIGADVYALYENATPASYGFYTLDADAGVTCGHQQLAAAAAAGFGDVPVYLGQSVHNPGRTRYQWSLTVPSAYPFHQWDTISGFGTWNYSSRPYAPTNGDLVRVTFLLCRSRGPLLTTGPHPSVAHRRTASWCDPCGWSWRVSATCRRWDGRP